MNRRQKIIVSVTGIFLVLLILVGLTYAYFLTRIDGNEAEKSISVTTANLAVKYSENDPTIVSKTLIKPDTVIGTKEFVVTNTGNATTNYSIVIDEVENNFERTEDLEYVLKRGEDIVATGTIKRMEAQIILSNISIEVGEENKHTYNFTVKYKEANTDQSVDMNKSLSLRLNIRRVSEWELATEGTLLAAIKRDNEVVDAISVPGKSMSGETYEMTKNDWKLPIAGMYLNENEYYTYSDEYVFNKESGTFSLINPQVALYSDALKGKFIADLAGNTTEEMTETTGLTYVHKVVDPTLVVSHGRIVTEIDESLLSSAEDDYGTSYYYRGSVNNNFVTFNNMCWRIVRIQGDGTIKLALADGNYPCSADVAANEDGTYSGYSSANKTSGFVSNEKYIFSSLTTEESIDYEKGNIPSILETWAIEKGLATKDSNTEVVTYNDLIVTTNWCNDTSISKKEYYDEDGNIIDGTDDENLYETYLYYAATDRIFDIENAHPTLRCNSEGLDGTTATKVNANIGLITADEVVFAGEIYETENNHNVYILTNANVTKNNALTMSPSVSYVTHSTGEVLGGIFSIRAIGGTLLKGKLIDDTSNSGGGYIRPLIAIKGNVTVTTNPDIESNGKPGTQGNPYVVTPNTN